MKPRYDLHVNLTPKYHDGHMQHYWAIKQTNEDGVFVVRDGFNRSYGGACNQAMGVIKTMSLPL